MTTLWPDHSSLSKGHCDLNKHWEVTTVVTGGGTGRDVMTTAHGQLESRLVPRPHQRGDGLVTFSQYLKLHYVDCFVVEL